jgi:hypothetical protein
VRSARVPARRLERLARRAHAFHRFAHHPLCDRYAGELIALRGRTRICRGCTLSLFGAVLAACAAMLWSLPAVPLACCSIAITALMLRSIGRAPSHMPRTSKLGTRAVPVGLVSASLISLLRVPTPAHLALGVVLGALCFACYRRYQRRGPNRAACVTCPELTRAPCSGFRQIVHAERAFVRRAQQLIDLAAHEDRAALP